MKSKAVKIGYNPVPEGVVSRPKHIPPIPKPIYDKLGRKI